MGIQLRDYQPDDLAALAELREDAAAQALLLSHPEARSVGDDVESWLSRRLDTTDGRFWVVADASDNAIGFVQFSSIHRLDRHARFGIALLGSRRGSGVGRGAIKEMIEAARGLGLRKLMCEVREDNIAACHLYRSLGFREVGVLLAHYDDGERLWDVVAMEKLLAGGLA